MSAMMIGMSACSKINNDTAKDVCDYLEQQYGCKFVATHIGDRLDKDTATLYVSPKDCPDIVFTAIIDHDGNVIEDYVPSLVAAKIEESVASGLLKSNIKCTVSATIGDDSIVETNTDISVDEFVEKYGISSIYVKVIFDDSPLDASTIINVLECTSSTLKTNLSVRCYILSSKSYVECREEFLKYPYVGSTAINNYLPINEFLIQVKDGKCDVDINSLTAILGV